VTVPECFAMLDAIGVPEWGLAYDCANEWLSGGEPPSDAALAERVARTRCVHVKARGAVPGLSATAVPWEKILFALASSGFAGPVSIETHNPDKGVRHVDMSKRLVDRIRQAWPGGAPAVRVKHDLDFEPVRFVVVGMGMGHSRARQLQREPGTKVIGVVDLNAERAEKAGKGLGVEWTTDLKPWLERKEVEAVFVVTPTGLHAEPAIAALNAGKHVISTKPMEANVAACDRMIAAADKAGKLLAVDFALRLERETQRMKQRIARGDLGRILGGIMSLRVLRTMDYFKASGGWRGTKKLDGGGIMSNQSIHHIDELVYILGLPKRVCMHTWTQTHQIEAEDLGCAVWEYADGAVIELYATTSYPQNTWYRNLELHGAEGAALHITGGPYFIPVERWFTKGQWESAPPEPQMLPWTNLGQNLAAAIRTGAPLVCDGRDGRRSRLVLDRMYESALKAGAWVEV
jgi:predicted dehydrogenase